MRRFPLHKLPENAYLLVLRQMDMFDQFSYSFCSKTSKTAVISLDLKASKIEMEVGSDVTIHVYTNDMIYFESITCFGKLTKVKIVLRSGDVKIWKFSKLYLKDWLQHICVVFHHSILDELSFKNSYFHIKKFANVQKSVQGLKIKTLSPPDNRDKFRREAITRFPCYEELLVDRLPNKEADKILTQNLKRIDISCSQNIKIDQILLSNCELINLRSSTLVETDLNKILKLWIRGSNPRLKQFNVSAFPTHSSRPIKKLVLKGIKYTKIPWNSEEVHRRKIFGRWNIVTRLAGGFRIKRFDGNCAVVLMQWGTFDLITDCVLSH